MLFSSFSNSRHRERHAKTLEIAQEEVLTCIGMFIYERLRRVHICLKEEENACQVLAAVAVHALCRSFDMAVENKRGISNLELLYKEISRAEKVKELRKEQKKLKKKKKKNDKKCLENRSPPLCPNCELDNPDLLECNCAIYEYDTEEQEQDTILMNNNCCNPTEIEPPEKISMNPTCCASNGDSSDELTKCSSVKNEISLFTCHSCEANVGGCSKSIDGGYVSEPTSSNHDGPCSVLSSRTSSIVSSPEGSEVACSDGFCNHDHPTAGMQSSSQRTTPECTAGGGGGSNSELQLTLQQMLVKFYFKIK